MATPNDRRKIESILREPLTRNRLLLNAKLRAAQNDENPQPFTLEDFKSFMASIRTADPEFKKETLNVLEAVQTGKAPQKPRFDTPETQLIWGAAFAFLTINPDQMKTWATPPAEGQTLPDTDLWKQVTTTDFAYGELLSHAHHIREALRDKDTKYGWGNPGTGFSYDRQKNLINIDFMQSMIVGFEHARADVYREIGHSLLSVTYPKRMKEVYKEMQPLMRKSRLAQMKKGPKLKPEEYKKLSMLSTEWQLRHMMFHAAEENVANRFVANMGQQLLQDFGVSLNNTAVTHRGVGLTRIPNEGSEELRRYMNLCNTVQLSFFANNSLFEDTDAGWAKVGIKPELVRKTGTLAARPAGQKDDKDGISHPDFQHLRELCGGAKGLENQQPKQHERLFGWANLSGRVQRADEERKKIVEEIWRDYAEDLIQKILQAANDQLDEQLDKAQKDPKNQQQQDAKDLDQDGDEQDGDDQDGQEQDGQGQGQGQGQGKGKGKGKPSKQKGQRGKPQGDQQDADDSDDADGDDADGQDGQDGKKSDKKGDKKDKGKKGDKQDGDDQDGDGQDGDDADGQDGDQEGQGKGKESKLGADDEETVPVEGAGDQPAPKGATEVPSDELDPNGEGNDGDGQDADGEGNDADGDDADGDDADGDDGMTAEDLEKELEKRKKEAEEADGDDADGDDADGQDADGDGDGQKAGKKQGKGKGNSKSKQAGHGDGRSLEELSRLDWTDYQKRISELAGPITRVRKIFKDVQERQLQRKRAVSPSLDMLPENGEVKDRFNVEAHRNLTIKKKIGDVQEEDLKRFHKDQVTMVPTEIDIVILIDGSGSMNGTPLLSALQAGAIMFEAASGKDMKMNVYVGMFGDSNPPMLIHPGADRVEIGKQMARAQKGLNSGTDLAPAIKKVAEVIGDQRGKSGTLSGFTHVLIISDGDMFDAEQTKDRIMTMFEYSDKVTFDTAIIGRQGTNMERMAKGIKGNKNFQDVGVTIGNNPNEIPMAIVGMLLEKVKKTSSFVAVPNSQKRRAMKKAHNKMDKDKRNPRF